MKIEWQLEKTHVEFEDKDNSYSMNLNLDEKMILKKIKQLPSGYRAVLNMYVFEQMSHEEIADVLQIQVSSSRSRLNRARALLTKELAALKIFVNER